MKTIPRMRVIFAGLFVFIGMVVGIDLISYWWGDKEPAWPWVIFVGIYNPLLILAAYVLFNLGVPRPWSPKPEDDARKLDEQGLLTEETLYATRALQVIDDYDDEGPSYLLELIDGGVLFLSGYYLYRIAMHRKHMGTFPCTEFTLQRHKQTGQVVNIVCSGTPLSPEIVPLAFSDVNFTAPVPEDGQIIRDRTYDELYAIVMRAIAKLSLES